MCQIEYIQTVVTYCSLTTSGRWTLAGGFPTNPDECVIRQITYSSADAARQMYLVQSSLTNGLIGSVVNMASFVSNPDTHIKFTGPIQPQITFQLLIPVTPSFPAVPLAGDTICISMDFIKYRR